MQFTGLKSGHWISVLSRKIMSRRYLEDCKYLYCVSNNALEIVHQVHFNDSQVVSVCKQVLILHILTWGSMTDTDHRSIRQQTV